MIRREGFIKSLGPIRTARLTANIETKQLARCLDVSIGAIGNWERGKFVPPPRIAKRLCAVLPGLTLDAIYADL